nr:hypothetical protein [Arthrobacter sp. PAMC 25486]
MLSKSDVGPWHLGDQSAVDHGLGTSAQFLGRLEQGNEGARPAVPALGHEPGRAEQGRDMHVLTSSSP